MTFPHQGRRAHRTHAPAHRLAWRAALAALALGACSPNHWYPPSPPPPVIAAFTATPSTIAQGRTATLSWSVSGATSLSIDGGVGAVTGTTVSVRPGATTTYTLTATNAGGPATSRATVTVTAPAPALLLSSVQGGPGLLGELTELPLAATGAETVLRTFSGTPWIDDPRHDAHGLAWNAADGRFYGVLNGGGAFRTGVLLSFDPASDELVLLKTLSGREYLPRAGLGGDVFPVEKATGFYRKPLPTLDGKGLLLLASDGGADRRGLLIHVDVDPASPHYLQEQVVYDFFDYEVGQGSYCDALRTATIAGQTELVWGQDGQGRDAVFMGRVGEDYAFDPALAASPGRPRNCNPYLSGGQSHDQIKGRVFALRPTDPADPSRPWIYAEGYRLLDPHLHLGRQLTWDGRARAVRWTTETAGGGDLGFHAGDATGSRLYFGATEQCYRLQGLLPLNARGDTIALCSGLNGSTTQPDSPPRIFDYTTNDLLDQRAALGGWYADRKVFRGATSSLLSRRLFANGGYQVDDCFEDAFGCESPSTLSEMDPVLGYPDQVLVTGDVNTTGRFMFGDPAVGGSVREPIADRYLVWFGAEVNGYSNTLNKHDRLTGLTSTIPLDPVAGAYPSGRLLDLGNGTALGFMDAVPPQGGAAVATRPGGYRGTQRHAGALRGHYLLDLSDGSVRGMFPVDLSMPSASVEQVRLDDGSLWVAFSEFNGSATFREIAGLDPATGSYSNLTFREEAWNYQPADAYALAGRGAALYLPFWESSVAPATSRFANVTLGCVRADDPAVTARSDLFGPASAATGNAHRIVYGATYSPANDAMYLATSKVAGADQGTIFEIDRGVAAADLCRARPVVTVLVSGLTDVPSTKPLSTRAGALLYGTAQGKLMRVDVAGRSVALVADLAAATAASSQVRGYLAEVGEGLVAAVVYDHDAAGRNTARRLVTVTVATGAQESRDVTHLIDEFEPYPGVMRLH
jgi:hypothetical protein